MAHHSPPPAPVFTLRSANGEVTAIHYTKGNELVSGHSSGHVQIWDLGIYRVSQSWSAHSCHRVQWIGSLRDGTIVSYGRDGFVRFWIVNEGELRAARSIAVDCCTHCPCDTTEKLLATPANDSVVNIRNVETGSCFSDPIAQLDQRSHLSNCGMVMTMKLLETHNKVLLLLGYECGIITVCDAMSSEVPLSRLSAHSEPITCLDFHTETMRGISGSADDNLVVWNMNFDGELSFRVRKSIANPGVASVKVHPSGVYVAVGGWDKRLRIFSWKTMKPLAVLDFHSGTVQCLDFVCRTDGSVLLVAGSQDGRLSLWDLYNGMKYEKQGGSKIQ